MVIFQGQPKETALSAVKAALEIRGKTLEINEELKNRFLPVEINMGINSGIAAVGMNRFTGISGTRMTFTASGPVTNLAARLASAARQGDILVGPETARRVAGDVELFERGFMSFKNVSDPVPVFSPVRKRKMGPAAPQNSASRPLRNAMLSRFCATVTRGWHDVSARQSGTSLSMSAS